MTESEAQGIERAHTGARREGGFTVIQLVIAFAVIAIVSTFAFMGIASARTSMRVQSSARQFAGYVEKARSDAIRRHSTATVQITAANATSYVVTLDFDLDGATETRTITLEDGVHINSDAATLTFDWRGRLTGAGLSLSFEGPDGSYPVQLDVTGSGDVTIGEEKFLDAEVPTVTLSNAGVSPTGDVSNDVSALTPTTTTPPTTTPPTTPPTTTPPTTPPTTTPPTTPPTTTPPTTPPTTTPPTTPPTTTPPSPPPSNPPGGGNPGQGNQPPATPPTTPPSTPPSTTPPATGTSCSMSVDLASVTINACNNGGNNCGSRSVKVTMVGAATGSTVSATSVPSNLTVTLASQSGSVYTFTIRAKNNTRTTNTVTFTGTSCGTKDVSVKTQ
jgi:Tfp pilus assembly protein FimT